MASHILLCLLFLIISVTHSQIVKCGSDPECNCPPSQTGETCILSCSETDICKAKKLNCRQGDPCIIECRSSATCSDGTTINAQSASDVTIVCEGDDACKVGIDIFCGTGPCVLLCSGETSCVDWGYIDVSLSSAFQCLGDCPKALPIPFTESPTATAIPSTTTLTPKPSKSPIAPTPNPTTAPSISPSIPIWIHSTNEPTYFPSILSSHGSTFAPSRSNTNATSIIQFILVDNDTNDKHFHDQYLKNPLFYGASIFLFVTFCGCCIFCIWVYNKEEQQKRIELKPRSASPIPIPLHPLPDIPPDPEPPMALLYPQSNVKQPFKDSIESSDLYEHNSELNEGPVPTTLKIQTIDMMSHCAVMQPHNLQIEIPHHALPNLPPPRSLPCTLSPWSSPPQTPIPNEVNSNGYVDMYHIPNIPNHADDDDVYQLRTEVEPGAAPDYGHHGHYSSLPTMPSLPSITNEALERSHSLSSVTNDVNTNRMRVSMVSCMILEDDSDHHSDVEELELALDVEESESVEYQSHRKRTYESYDYVNQFSVGNLTAKQMSQVSNPTEFGSSVIGKSSTIKLHAIVDTTREDRRQSASQSFSLSETSVSKHSDHDKNKLHAL